MIRMTEQHRREWMHGTARQQREHSAAVERGDFHCDDCPARAIAISHRGAGSAVRVECATHFRASLDAERASRPSAAELLRRVNEAIGVGG